MGRWIETKLGSLFEKSKGKKPLRTFDVQVKESIPYLTMEYLNGQGVQYAKDGLKVDENVILIASDGSGSGTTYLGRKGYVSSTFLALYPKSTEKNYLFFLLNFLDTKSDKYRTGGAIPHFDPNVLTKEHFNIPESLDEQRKIAQILSKVDEAIDSTQALIDKHELIKEGMMHDLFTRGIDPATGSLRPHPSDAPELYQDSELGLIPKEWERGKMKDVCDVNQGLQIPITSRFKDNILGTHVYITVQYLNDTKNLNNTFFIKSPTSSVVCCEDDILMTRTGNTGAVYTGLNGVFHNNFFKVIYDIKKITKNYLFLYLQKKEIYQLIMNYAGTTTIPDLKHGDFFNLPMNYPKNQYEQRLITESVDLINKKIKSLHQQKQKLLLQKQGLMHDLLSGTVRVME